MSVDPAEKSAALAQRLGLTFPLASDPARATVAAYGVLDEENDVAWPALFVVERDGTISWRWLADDYKVRPTTAELLEALDRVSRS